MTDSMGPGKLVRHMQNLSYTYDEYLICIGLGPSILSFVCKNLSYSGPSYPSSPVYCLQPIDATKVTLDIAAWIYDTKDKNIVIEDDFTKSFKKSYWLCFV